MADEKTDATAAVQNVVDTFHQIYYHGVMKPRPIWFDTFWMGHRVHKCPFDLWVYQEIIMELKPEVIVETGVAKGGSLVYLRSMCDLAGRGEIIGVDIAISEEAKPVGAMPGITLLEGSSTDPAIFEKIRGLVADRPALVILDSDHAKDHVLREMKLYRDLVPVGGYMIVEDSNVNSHPVHPNHGIGPFEAINDFISEIDDFEIDKSREKFYMSFNPNGYLKRVK